MFILSFLSAGMWFALGLFEREYSKAMQSGTTEDTDNKTPAAPVKRAPSISTSKRED